MSQYALSLILPPVFAADNFIVSGCNREAWQWMHNWPQWPAHALILYGPEGSGKTHLGHIWAGYANAEKIAADTLTGDEPAKKHILVEDIERASDEKHLLHLFNYTRENGNYLLMTSSLPPQNLPFRLPDLTSRLLALPCVQILQADDTVLAGAMRKQFSDRQMKIDDEVIAYILPRVERSLSKVKELVEHLDRVAMAQRKNITVPFVKYVLESNQENSLF